LTLKGSARNVAIRLVFVNFHNKSSSRGFLPACSTRDLDSDNLRIAREEMLKTPKGSDNRIYLTKI